MAGSSGPRVRSSGDYSQYRPPEQQKDNREHKAFFTLLLVTTITCLVLVISACSVLAYFRVRHGPLTFGEAFTPSCPFNQEWSVCGYACNLTCTEQFKVCATVCREGCECPDQAPLWHMDKCVSREQCPTQTENVTVSLNGYFNKNSPTEVDSDTLHFQHELTETDKLSQFVQTLWSDTSSTFNYTYLVYDLQARTQPTMAVDLANKRLFEDTQYELSHTSHIYSTFTKLLGHYNVHVKEAETMSGEKQRAISAFLDSVLTGVVMRQTETFLKQQGLISEQSFRELLYSLWFDPYPRSTRYNITDSSGFEHVFVGEVKGRKILGLHNWIQFYLLEKFQDLNYYGYINDVYLTTNQKLIGLSVQFTWNEQRKRQGSFLVGTSPDFELAVYTVCFLLHPDRVCGFQLEGTELRLQTHDVKHVTGWQISSVYPLI